MNSTKTGRVSEAGVGWLAGLQRVADLEASIHYLCSLFISPVIQDILVGKVLLELFGADLMTNVFSVKFALKSRR